MKVRADLAELLHAGHSDRAIGRQLNVDPVKTVAPARTLLGLPKAKPGRKPAATPEDLFWNRVQPVDDGHILWAGHRQPPESGRCPVFRHGGKLWSAYRVAFKIRHGREPEGKVTPTCDRDGCVAPDHTQDRRIRQASRPTVQKPGSRPRYASLEDAFKAKTERLDGGHVRWRGYLDATSNTPILFNQGQQITAPRAAFVLHQGRNPVGKPLPTCGMKGCIAGDHLADRPMREANRRADKAFDAIFGDPP